MIESATYTESGAILATIDGVVMAVPDTMANHERRLIAEWEAAGNTIAAYVPPVPSSVKPLQMRKALRAAGLKAQADAYAASLSEEAQEAWEYASVIMRDDPFIEGARLALGMTQAQADDLFRLADSL